MLWLPGCIAYPMTDAYNVGVPMCTIWYNSKCSPFVRLMRRWLVVVIVRDVVIASFIKNNLLLFPLLYSNCRVMPLLCNRTRTGENTMYLMCLDCGRDLSTEAEKERGTCERCLDLQYEELDRIE